MAKAKQNLSVAIADALCTGATAYGTRQALITEGFYKDAGIKTTVDPKDKNKRIVKSFKYDTVPGVNSKGDAITKLAKTGFIDRAHTLCIARTKIDSVEPFYLDGSAYTQTKRELNGQLSRAADACQSGVKFALKGSEKSGFFVQVMDFKTAEMDFETDLEKLVKRHINHKESDATVSSVAATLISFAANMQATAEDVEPVDGLEPTEAEKAILADTVSKLEAHIEDEKKTGTNG